jgi:hypothetical protein
MTDLSKSKPYARLLNPHNPKSAEQRKQGARAKFRRKYFKSSAMDSAESLTDATLNLNPICTVFHKTDGKSFGGMMKAKNFSYVQLAYDELEEGLKRKALRQAKREYRRILSDENTLVALISEQRITFHKDGSLYKLIPCQGMFVTDGSPKCCVFTSRERRRMQEGRKPGKSINSLERSEVVKSREN